MAQLDFFFADIYFFLLYIISILFFVISEEKVSGTGMYPAVVPACHDHKKVNINRHVTGSHVPACKVHIELQTNEVKPACNRHTFNRHT